MRKFVVFLLVIIAIMVGWKYVGDYVKKSVIQTAPGAAVNDTLDTVGGYIPTQLENKKIMENRINDSVQKENDRLKGSLGAGQ